MADEERGRKRFEGKTYADMYRTIFTELKKLVSRILLTILGSA